MLDRRDVVTVRDHDAVNWSIGRNRNVVNDPINRVAQKLEAGDKRNIELAVRELLTQCRWMIEIYLVRPAADEGTGVEIFYATDAQ